MRMIPEELLAPLSFAGTPEDLQRQLRDLAASGGDRLDEIVLLPCLTPGQTSLQLVTRFAQEVIPALHR